MTQWGNIDREIIGEELSGVAWAAAVAADPKNADWAFDAGRDVVWNERRARLAGATEAEIIAAKSLHRDGLTLTKQDCDDLARLIAGLEFGGDAEIEAKLRDRLARVVGSAYEFARYRVSLGELSPTDHTVKALAAASAAVNQMASN